MAEFAPLNADDPPELLQHGTSNGKSLKLDLISIEEHAHSRAANILKASRSRKDTTEEDNNSHEHESTKLPSSDDDGYAIIEYTNLVALKVIFAPDIREPHNIRKEIRIMASLKHDNICPLFNAYYINSHYILAMPFFHKTLANLLDEPSFVPSPKLERAIVGKGIRKDTHNHDVGVIASRPSNMFPRVAQNIIKQMCQAVAVLEDQKIAHRDISPSNWLISFNGEVVLTDFGVAWDANDPGLEGNTNLCFELGTGPFRAPELLFGSKAYNPFALDRWALGVNIASLFTHIGPVRLPSPESSDDDGDDDNQNFTGRWSRPSFLSTAAKEARRYGPIKRSALFDGGYSDFALIGSIFRSLGTPNVDTWPEAQDLPDFGKFRYKDFPVPPLADLLENLPSPSDSLHGSPIDVISRMLVYPFDRRLSAKDALQLPYLCENAHFNWNLSQIIAI